MFDFKGGKKENLVTQDEWSCLRLSCVYLAEADDWLEVN